MRSSIQPRALLAALVLAAVSAPTAAINLGAVDLAATSYLNNSLSDCTACYGDVRKARCHRVVLGIYLRDLSLKNAGVPGVPSVAESIAIISGSEPQIRSPTGRLFFSNNIFCRGFNQLIAQRALSVAVLNQPPRELYYVRGAASFLVDRIGGGATVASDVLRVAANGQLTSIGGRLKFSRATGITSALVRATLVAVIGEEPWRTSKFTDNIANVQLDQVSNTVVEVIIPFEPNAQF